MKKIRPILLIIIVFKIVEISYLLFTEDGEIILGRNCMSLIEPTLLFMEDNERLPFGVYTPLLQYVYTNHHEPIDVQFSPRDYENEVVPPIEVIEATSIGISEEDADFLVKKAEEENKKVVFKEEEKAVSILTPKVVYEKEKLQDIDFIRKEFYTEDPTTHINEDMLSYDKLMNYDASLIQDNSKPQILIYHTHSQEGYIDSVKEDASTTIMGVGEYLSEILRKKYGYNVIHHLGMYDVESRDYAYSNAAEGIEKVLKENPSIEVMIDLHRDEVKNDTRLVTNIDGKDMARFMFFNGLCYTKELGKLNNLQNDYIQENLAIAFQMQLYAKEYYPGLTRKTYLKGYRYNLHYRPKSILIELGAQNNTYEEAINSCIPLGDIINKVLSK